MPRGCLAPGKTGSRGEFVASRVGGEILWVDFASTRYWRTSRALQRHTSARWGAIDFGTVPTKVLGVGGYGFWGGQRPPWNSALAGVCLAASLQAPDRRGKVSTDCSLGLAHRGVMPVLTCLGESGIH